MSNWILVFWLVTPNNFAEHNHFKTEYECNQAVVVWNQRLQQVKSKMIAECRIEQNNSLQADVKVVK